MCFRHNASKNMLVWVNEEDHMRFICMQKGGNIRQVFERFCNGLKQVRAAAMTRRNDDAQCVVARASQLEHDLFARCQAYFDGDNGLFYGDMSTCCYM